MRKIYGVGANLKLGNFSQCYKDVLAMCLRPRAGRPTIQNETLLKAQ